MQHATHVCGDADVNKPVFTIALQLPPVFSTVTCCSLVGSTTQVCVSALYDVRTMMKWPNGAFLRQHPHC